MALWSRPDHAAALAEGPGEYLGRTAEEAIARAREALGQTAELRCWKTRRGGVAGFFATEVFVAGVTPPAGAERTPRKARRAQKQAANAANSSNGHGTGVHAFQANEAVRDGSKTAPTTPPVGPTSAPDTVDTGIADTLASLVEETNDQLSLHLGSLHPDTFDRVLAEAEAAIADHPDDAAAPATGAPDESTEEPAAGHDDAAAAMPAAENAVENAVESPADSAAGSAGTALEAVAEPTSGSPTAPAAPPVTPAKARQRRKPARAKAPTTPKAAAKPAPRPAAPKATAPNPTAPTAPPAKPQATKAPAPPAPAPKPAPKPAAQAPPKPAPAPAPKPATAALPAAPAAPKAPTGPAPRPIPDLFERLRNLGVPERHLPRGNRPTLDALVRSLSRLPAAAPLPTELGSVVAVVGTPGPIDRTVRLLLGDSPFRHGARRDPARPVWDGGAKPPVDDLLGDVLQTGEPVEVAGRVAMRRLAGHLSLVPIEAPPGAVLRPRERTVLESIQADYVLGAVSAGTKRADLEQWSRDLGIIHAVALWGIDSTVSPADLLGALPIAFVDGEASSPMGWTVTLLSRAMEPDR